MRPDIVLAIDTAAAHCAAAVLFGHRDAGLAGIRRIEARVEPMDKGQADRLVPMLEEMLAAEGLGWGDLTALVVGTGPGNFTGIRISVALVRGLALALDVPAIGVDGFQTLARSGGLATPFWSVIEAPRGQVFAQRFPHGASDGPESPPVQLDEGASFDAPTLRRSQITTADFVRALASVGYMNAISGQAFPQPAPFYLRGADALPPSDPPPVIL